MEDVLEVYHRPYDPKHPQVCLDETNKTLRADKREPEPMQPGKPARQDYEYIRNGSANLFLWFEPLAGRRQAKVTERRTKQDCAVDWFERRSGPIRRGRSPSCRDHRLRNSY